MKPYRILIGPKESPRLSFPVMAQDSFTALDQHMELAGDGERVQVLAMEYPEEVLNAGFIGALTQ